MSNNEQFDGEFSEVDPKTTNKRPNKNGLGKVFLVGLCAGVLGGGVVVGGYALYQGRENTQLSATSSGTTQTSKLNVNVSTQTTKAFDTVKDAIVSVEAYSSEQSSSSLEDLFGQGSDSSDSSSQTSTSEGSGVSLYI